MMIQLNRNVYELILPVESTEMFRFFRVDTSFMGPSLNAPLFWQVDGIVGQMNTLSDPPLLGLGGHNNAIY